MFADTSSQGFSVSEAEKPKAEGQLARVLCPCDFPDNTGVGCHSLLQGSNLCLLRWQADSLPWDDTLLVFSIGCGTHY